MNIPQKHQAELTKIIVNMREALTAQPEECRQIVAQALRRAERLAEDLATAPAKLGQMGGRETAKRGGDYFRQLAAMRKTKAGGRPKVDRANRDRQKT